MNDEGQTFNPKDVYRQLAEEQARGAALREALAKVDEIACRTVTGNHPEDLPEPANRDGEELAKLSREAIALPADSTALDAALADAAARARAEYRVWFIVNVLGGEVANGIAEVPDVRRAFAAALAKARLAGAQTILPTLSSEASDTLAQHDARLLATARAEARAAALEEAIAAMHASDDFTAAYTKVRALASKPAAATCAKCGGSGFSAQGRGPVECPDCGGKAP